MPLFHDLVVPRFGLKLIVAICTLSACSAGDTVKAPSASGASSIPAFTPVSPGPVQSSDPNAAAPSATTPAVPGAACGYKGLGTTLHVAAGIDVCLPPSVCTSETCPPPLGDCVAGKCVYKSGYQGLATLSESWATYYCQLASGGCNGITQIEPPLTTATKVGALLKMPVCEGNKVPGPCVGIAASSAMLIGNSQIAIDPATGGYVKPWGLGTTEASGLCYSVTGPGGQAVVALTDRCGGYCKCNGSGFAECGPCVSAASMVPNCPCVGTAPPLYSGCCGSGCATVVPACDWCATNNHPHFDLDAATFNYVCGTSATQGSCKLTAVAPVACAMGVSWPPP